MDIYTDSKLDLTLSSIALENDALLVYWYVTSLVGNDKKSHGTHAYKQKNGAIHGISY